MIGALNDFDHRFLEHCAAGMAVVGDVNRILGTDDHEGGCVHVLQLILGEVRPATAGNHGANQIRAAGGGDHGGRRTGAGTEEADVHGAGLTVFREPVDHCGQPGGDPVDVFRIVWRDGVEVVRIVIGEVRQGDGEATVDEALGDEAVARTEAAPAGSVDEDDDGVGIGRDLEDSIIEHVFGGVFQDFERGDCFHGCYRSRV